MGRRVRIMSEHAAELVCAKCGNEVQVNEWCHVHGQSESLIVEHVDHLDCVGASARARWQRRRDVSRREAREK